MPSMNKGSRSDFNRQLIRRLQRPTPSTAQGGATSNEQVSQTTSIPTITDGGEITVLGSVSNPSSPSDPTVAADRAMEIAYMSDITGASLDVFPYLVVRTPDGKRFFRLQEDVRGAL